MGTCERLCLQTLHAEITETILSVVRGMLTCTQAELSHRLDVTGPLGVPMLWWNNAHNLSELRNSMQKTIYFILCWLSCNNILKIGTQLCGQPVYFSQCDSTCCILFPVNVAPLSHLGGGHNHKYVHTTCNTQSPQIGSCLISETEIMAISL